MRSLAYSARERWVSVEVARPAAVIGLKVVYLMEIELGDGTTLEWYISTP